MLILTGATFLLLALLSGLALLAAPFGFGNASGSINWLVFPLSSLIGPALFMFSSESARAAKTCGLAGGALVVLGLAGLVAAFLAGNNLLPAKAIDTSALWYVAGVGLVFGSAALGLKTLLDGRLDRSEPR